MPANRMMPAPSADSVRQGFVLSDMLSGLAGRRRCGNRLLFALLAGSTLLLGSLGWRAAVAQGAPVEQRTQPAAVQTVATRHSAAKDSAAKSAHVKVAAVSHASTKRADKPAAGKKAAKAANAKSSARKKASSTKAAAKRTSRATSTKVATRASAGKKQARASSTSASRKTASTKRSGSSRAVSKKGVLVADKAPVRLNRAQQGVARHISRKYRVPQDSIERYVGYAYQSGRTYNVDPYLILAVMATESSFNPRAESRVGAQGLMQVHTRVHKDRFKPYGSTKMVWQPKVNIQVGSSILAGYIKRYGSERRALKAYVGAANMSHDFGYGRKVLKRRDEFLSVSIAARNGGATSQAAAESRRKTRDL